MHMAEGGSISSMESALERFSESCVQALVDTMKKLSIDVGNKDAQDTMTNLEVVLKTHCQHCLVSLKEQFGLCSTQKAENMRNEDEAYCRVTIEPTNLKGCKVDECKDKQNTEIGAKFAQPIQRDHDLGHGRTKHSNTWKFAVHGVLQKQRRERIRGKDITDIEKSSFRKVPKSQNTKDRLQSILRKHFLFGDLDVSLRDEIIEAFEDVRVDPGTEIIRQGDVADNFYVIDVGEFDIFASKGNEVPILVKTKGPGESFGDLALMYDCQRSATVKVRTYSLVWAVDRVTFRTIMSHHLSGSLTAQLLREAPVLKNLSTPDVVRLSRNCANESFKRGQVILKAGCTMEKVYIIQKGQVRVSSGSISSIRSNSPDLSGGENIAVMSRLDVLGEYLILNGEKTSFCNYIASSEHVQLLAVERMSFGKHQLLSIRKELQVQLVTLSLQRVPVFIQFTQDHLLHLANIFSEEHRKAGDELIKQGDVSRDHFKVYVVQKGRISLRHFPENAISTNLTHRAPIGIGSRLGSFFVGRLSASSAPQSPRQSISDESRHYLSYTETYGVLGAEVIPHCERVNNYHLSSQVAATVESQEGSTCLTASLSKILELIGPINEQITKVSNSKVLRKVPCLEYLTAKEIEILSYSLGILKLAPGSNVYKSGDRADCMYIVCAGAVVEVYENRKSKEDQVVHSKGSYFGEQALLSSEPRSTTTTAGDGKNPGLGLFGSVNLAYCRKTNEHYALKCISKDKVVKLQEEEHIRDEKLLMEALDHPFIARLIRTFKDQKHVYLLQELTIGKELFALMENMGCLQEWEAAFYAGAILLALEYMHDKGVVYRDLKPENTLIGENGYPKLVDLGFAKRIFNHRTYSMCGTPDYMAPEIIKRNGHGKAVDYWALGCMIYEMLTNTSPFNRHQDPPQARLRCGARGVLDIKEHPFFTKHINFQRLYYMKEDPPIIPPKLEDYSSICCKEQQSFTNHCNDLLSGSTMSSAFPNWDDVF